ncbi:MAG TPA: alpha/beta fold hydrolase [Ilumatobacteraceae bacterium]|jgi:pimeloyl-ACP methyl ester carboxylesterase
MPAESKHLVYLFGIAGHPELSPAMSAVQTAGWRVVVPNVPGFDGQSGFEPRDEYLDWLTTYWDALDATGALPCPVVGASLGGLIAADLAALRPEAVTGLALLAPLGITDASQPGFNLFGTPASERMAHLFAKGMPEAFVQRFAELGPEEAPVASYLSDVAAANILWPLNDRGVAKRLHRITAPRLTMWGDLDEISPVGNSAAWGGAQIVPGAGHLLEWDAPDVVAAVVLEFLRSLGG